MKKILIAFTIAILSIAFVSNAKIYAANDAGINTDTRGQEVKSGTVEEVTYTCGCTSNFLGFPSWNCGLKCSVLYYDEKGKEVSTQEHVVIGDGENEIPTTIWTVVLNVMRILLQVAGIVAVCFLIFNGYQYLTSNGDSSKISKAKTGLLQAIVGLAIAVLSSTIIYFIVGSI